jgi:hypothetical protein
MAMADTDGKFGGYKVRVSIRIQNSTSTLVVWSNWTKLFQYTDDQFYTSGHYCYAERRYKKLPNSSAAQLRRPDREPDFQSHLDNPPACR